MDWRRKALGEVKATLLELIPLLVTLVMLGVCILVTVVVGIILTRLT